MYLYLSAEKAVKTDEIIGIFDLDTTTVAKSTAALRRKAEGLYNAGFILNVA